VDGFERNLSPQLNFWCGTAVASPLSIGFLGSDSKRARGQRRQSVRQSTKDTAKGRFHEVRGGVKEKVGRATNNPDLVAEGQVEKIAGKVQKKVGQVRKVLGK
jgi:uncharacterized protein YjbJ (UPF0337 family)